MALKDSSTRSDCKMATLGDWNLDMVMSESVHVDLGAHCADVFWISYHKVAVQNSYCPSSWEMVQSKAGDK